MRHHILLALFLACTACVAETEAPGDVEPSVEATTQHTEVCGDLVHQYFEVPRSCTLPSGQLGTKICHTWCDLDRALKIGPPGQPPTCQIVGSTCNPDPWACGPCRFP